MKSKTVVDGATEANVCSRSRGTSSPPTTAAGVTTAATIVVLEHSRIFLAISVAIE